MLVSRGKALLFLLLLPALPHVVFGEFFVVGGVVQTSQKKQGDQLHAIGSAIYLFILPSLLT